MHYLDIPLHKLVILWLCRRLLQEEPEPLHDGVVLNGQSTLDSVSMLKNYTKHGTVNEPHTRVQQWASNYIDSLFGHLIEPALVMSQLKPTYFEVRLDKKGDRYNGK